MTRFDYKVVKVTVPDPYCNLDQVCTEASTIYGSCLVWIAVFMMGLLIGVVVAPTGKRRK